MKQYIKDLIDKLSRLLPGQRYILGITGYPAAGKSTIAAELVKEVNQCMGSEVAIVVPMDGYHYSNETLRQMNLLELKGIPDTFDAVGFVDLLKKLRSNVHQDVLCPRFDRHSEASVPNAIVITPQHKLCVVEGNYLLLQKKPWDECGQYFDQVWFIDVTYETILPRLQKRHMEGGRTAEEAMRKVESTDLPNARLIEATKPYADRLLKLDQ